MSSFLSPLLFEGDGGGVRLGEGGARAGRYGGGLLSSTANSQENFSFLFCSAVRNETEEEL